MDNEKIGLIAQEISFAFEDNYVDEEKRKQFISIFDKYLAAVEPAAAEPYDAMLTLGQSNPSEFEKMLKEFRDLKLI